MAAPAAARRAHPAARVRVPGPDRARTRSITRAIARARILDSAPWLTVTAALALLLLDSAAVLSGHLPDGTPGQGSGIAHTLQEVGSWMAALGLLFLLDRGRTAYRDPSSRSAVGVLWDAGTFWPRAAHPFAPPCYAERAVPDLAWRIATWVESTDGRVLISGHSQGSVLAAAAVWQLPSPVRRRIALLTYGSPLERIYGRWFPAYFGPGALDALHREVDCWGNLWRLTDPVGGPVRVSGGGPAVDRGPLPDPFVYGRTREHPLPRPVLGHGDYRSDPAFSEERAALAER
ncbi:hypothetical protein OIE63_04670 [Streptomyces sp. NBC_01795]|uniref:hypothetical protein n=1 Tax=Streptomyces sp. NBC_01795 TaxID=2975943 RepID=UPI002DDB8F61|nr:hypothetical protein [Streptomyces sp. NBC_01795]WSA90910.1 hypothetical protein OIE63_04670 [Streptomyces sp. NBC_01795]